MNIGIRAHDLGCFDSVATLAEAVKTAGLDSVQLVAWKALKEVKRQPGLWTPELVESLRHDLVGAGVSVPLVGAYFNWYHQSELSESKTDNGKKRQAGGLGRQIFKESLTASCSIGANTVGTEIEGYSALPLWYSRKNKTEAVMEHAIQLVQDLAETAENSDTCIGIEGVWFHVLNTPEKVRELKDRSGVKQIRFIFDPVNFLTPRNWRRQEEIMDRAIELYDEDLILIHCKDFLPTPLALIPVPPGKGRLNYRYLADRLAAAGKLETPFILEGVTGKAIPESASFLRKLS